MIDIAITSLDVDLSNTTGIVKHDINTAMVKGEDVSPLKMSDNLQLFNSGYFGCRFTSYYHQHSI